MTETEIIRILTDYGTQCKPEVISEAVNLIERKNAEIERLNAKIKELMKDSVNNELYKEMAEAQK